MSHSHLQSTRRRRRLPWGAYCWESPLFTLFPQKRVSRMSFVWCNGNRRLLLENDCDSQRIERNTFWENPINCIQGSSVLPVEHYDSVVFPSTWLILWVYIKTINWPLTLLITLTVNPHDKLRAFKLKVFSWKVYEMLLF